MSEGNVCLVSHRYLYAYPVMDIPLPRIQLTDRRYTVIKEIELPKLNSRKKVSTCIIDTDTNEVLVYAELTPASTKRMIKEYAIYGIYAEVKVA